MGQKSRWALPVVPDPPDRLCFRVEVPNDQNHIAAFLGAVYELSKPYSWQNDAGHTALIAGSVWSAIFDQLQQQSCEDCAIPIAESDYEMSICEQLRWQDGKLQALCCGTWTDIPGTTGAIVQGGSNPPAGGTPAAGACVSYDMLLKGNDRWLLPVPVAAGDTITITLAQGGWSDGTVTWACPDGSNYVLGACVGNQGHLGGDPLGSAFHMRLIANYNAVYVDAYNLTITIPANIAPTQLFFQANDAVLTDNQGSISAHIEICKAATPTWCAIFNAAHGWSGWTAVTQGGGTPALTAGVWNSAHSSVGYEGLNIQAIGLALPAGTLITELRWKGKTTFSGTNSANINVGGAGSSGVGFIIAGTGPANPSTVDYPGLKIGDATVTLSALNNSAPGGAATTITEYAIFGSGPTPIWAVAIPC